MRKLVIVTPLAFTALAFSTVDSARAQELRPAVDLCSVSSPSLISTALGRWKGTQRKWNVHGELQRTLLSDALVELRQGANKGDSPAVWTQATYSTTEGSRFSQNDFSLTCDGKSGIWKASVPGFGEIQVTPLSAHAAYHVVDAKTEAGQFRSVSLWDFSAPGKWILTTTWYMNNVVTGTSVNQMELTP
jgi:hypothetical protein